MRIDVLSKEYPPEVYGGAGVHVAELVRALRVLPDVDARVRCFGAPRSEPGTTAYAEPSSLADANPAIRTLGVDLAMVDDCAGADLVHSHTWYANMAGHLAGADARHPARRQRPLPRADAAVEGRAARRRLRPVELGGADGVRGRRRDRRGERGDARRRAAQLSGGRPGARPRRAQRHRHHAVVPDRQPRPGPRARRRPRPAERDLRRPDHPPEGPAALPPRRGRAAARRAARAVRRRARHPRDRWPR